MKSLVNSVNVGPYNIDIHQHPGIACSGGADSAILLYILMKYSTNPIRVYSLASKEKFRSAARVSHDVISKCMDLTGRSDVYHYVLYTDKQNNQLLFDQPQKDLAARKINILYTGLTLIPSSDVLATFNNSVDDFVKTERDPSTVHQLYNGPYYSPFANINKQQIKELYDMLEVTEELFPITRSCESLTQSTGHCGECWWCEERRWAFGRLE
jgi:hypothetical protein